MFGIFAALAEFERELIIERTHAGLASARARGRNGGRPFKMTAAKLRLAQSAMGQPGTKVGELCAENDSWFRPGLVSRMRAAFTGSGGRAELVMLPPFRDDGHAMFFAPGGRGCCLPELDRFLRVNGLPTWDEAVFAPLLARLSLRDRKGVETYLRLPAEKALALAPADGVY